MNMMISYQELVRTFLSVINNSVINFVFFEFLTFQPIAQVKLTLYY